jgi:hypothetical protein
MRVILRPQIIFQNGHHLSIRTEIPRNMRHRKPKMECPYSIIKSKAMQSTLCDENIKINNEPICDKHLFSKF